jgi:hypothetical protein
VTPEPERFTVTIRLVRLVRVKGFMSVGPNVPSVKLIGGPFCVSVVCTTLVVKLVIDGPSVPDKPETGVVRVTMQSARASAGLKATMVKRPRTRTIALKRELLVLF